MITLAVFYWCFAVGYAMDREDYGGKVWDFAWRLVLSTCAFPAVLGADLHKVINRPLPSYQLNTNIHNHTNGDVTITRL